MSFTINQPDGGWRRGTVLLGGDLGGGDRRGLLKIEGSFVHVRGAEAWKVAERPEGAPPAHGWVATGESEFALPANRVHHIEWEPAFDQSAALRAIVERANR